MSSVDLSSLTIEEPAGVPKRPYGPRLLGAFLVVLVLGTGLTFLWPVLRPTRVVTTAPIYPTGSTPAAAKGMTVAQAVGWVEPDPFPVHVQPLVSGRIDTIDVLEGRDVVAGETVIATMSSAALLAHHQLATAKLAEANAAQVVAQSEAHKARAQMDQHADHRSTLAGLQVALAAKQTGLATARSEVKRLAAEARGAAAARDAQVRLAEGGTRNAVAVERASAAAEAAAAALVTAQTKVSGVGEEVVAARAAVDLAKELLAQPRDLEWNLKIAAAKTRRAEAAVALAKVDLAIATRELGQAREVLSPVSGTVLRLLSQPGEVAGPAGKGIVALYDPAKLQARIDVPLDSVRPVTVGQRVELTSEVTGDTVVSGVVRRVQRESDMLKNTLQVKVGLQAPPAIWRPETLCRARFLGGDEAAGAQAGLEDTFSVPSSAVKDSVVYVLDVANGRARAVEVTVLAQGAGMTTVRGALSATQRVIVSDVGDGEAVEEGAR